MDQKKETAQNVSIGSHEDAIRIPGTKGKLSWRLEEGILTLFGQGAVPNYRAGEPTPWEACKQMIRTVIAEPGVSVIGDRAFQDCPQLKKVTLAAGVRRVGFRAFARCPLLEQVECPGELIHFRSGQPGVAMGTQAFAQTPWQIRRFGEYYIHDGVLLEYFGSGGAVKIPEGVNIVGNMAFEGSDITAVELPASLREIRPFAFAHTQLTQVELPGTLEQVGEHAFRECALLRRVCIHNRKTRIAPTAFAGTPLEEKQRREQKNWLSIHTLVPAGQRGIKSCKRLVYREKTGVRIGVPELDMGRAILRKLRAGSMVVRIRLDEEKKHVHFVQAYAYDGFWGTYSVQLMFPCRDEDGSLTPWRDSNTFLDDSDILYMNTEGLGCPGRYQWYWCRRGAASQDTVCLELLEQWLNVNPEYGIDSVEENLKHDCLRMFVPA